VSDTTESKLSIPKTLVLCLAILLAGLLFTGVIFSTEPEAEREAATKRTPMLVEVVEAEFGDFSPRITAMGTVKPTQEIMLRSRVSGEIIEIGNNFIPGGFVKKGDLLLQIDPADYRHELQQRESELAQAEADLAIERGEQQAARLDYERLDRSLSGMQKELILRQPQLRSAEARVASAQAAADKAQLDLMRTSIRAPFDAQITRRDVNVGSQVGINDNLAELIGLQQYWVEATLPLAKLPWLVLPQDGQPGSTVTLRNRTAWPKNTSREGLLDSVIGELNSSTRMARALIKVSNPLAIDQADQPALIVGSYLECEIQARTIKGVVRLNRNYLRKNNTTWVKENNTLAIRDLDIVFTDSRYAYVKKGLQQGDQIVTTDLSRVRDGAELRLKNAEAP